MNVIYFKKMEIWTSNRFFIVYRTCTLFQLVHTQRSEQSTTHAKKRIIQQSAQYS
jgi:hypothetical protein